MRLNEAKTLHAEIEQEVQKIDSDIRSVEDELRVIQDEKKAIEGRRRKVQGTLRRLEQMKHQLGEYRIGFDFVQSSKLVAFFLQNARLPHWKKPSKHLQSRRNARNCERKYLI